LWKGRKRWLVVAIIVHERFVGNNWERKKAKESEASNFLGVN
jgi:hypothetical protein